MTDFSAYIGRSRSETERLDARLVRWLAAIFERPELLNARGGEALPAGWHWTLFAPVAAMSGLGRDGHPQRGDFLPPTTQPRRMWAGSRLHWHASFQAESLVTRTTTIKSCEEKAGRSGSMVFVTLEHRLESDGRLVLEEEQDLVYRGDAGPDEVAALARLAQRAQSESISPEKAGAFNRAVSADPVMLFRYSAATFNGHRIHYDRDYAREVEGYPGLVVHGPIIASLLLGFIEREVAPGRRVERFAFRAKRPTFDISAFALHADRPDASGELAVWSTNNVGEVAVEATARLA